MVLDRIVFTKVPGTIIGANAPTTMPIRDPPPLALPAQTPDPLLTLACGTPHSLVLLYDTMCVYYNLM